MRFMLWRSRHESIRFTQAMKNRQIIISTALIRRGGFLSGAAAFIIVGGRGVSTPISNS